MRRFALALTLLLFVVSAVARAKTIAITPADDYTKVESAQPDDVVEIEPGTYRFLVRFTTPGTAGHPITVRARDPANRPVWDLSGVSLSTAPGSATDSERGRGCWQVRAGYYVLDGIVWKGCRGSGSAALYVGGVPAVTVLHAGFFDSTNGVTGAGEPLVIQFSEFSGNGIRASVADDPAHQINIDGGVFEMRYSLVRDAAEGQALAVRARSATVEYNWIARPGSYLGSLVSCQSLCGGVGAQPIAQAMLLRGNVLIQGTPSDPSQLWLLANDRPGGSLDATGAVDSLDLTLVGNTVVGSGATASAVVHQANDTVSTAAHLSNNALLGFGLVTLVDALGGQGGTVDGTHNWAHTGTDVDALDATKLGQDAMLTAGYVPLAQSPLVGAAAGVGSLAPTFEYYRDESERAQGRARATARDVGAFESGNTAAPFDGRASDGGVAGGDGGGGGGTGGGVPTGGGVLPSREGCACTLGGRSAAPRELALLLVVLVLAWEERVRKRRDSARGPRYR